MPYVLALANSPPHRRAQDRRNTPVAARVAQVLERSLNRRLEALVVVSEEKFFVRAARARYDDAVRLSAREPARNARIPAQPPTTNRFVERLVMVVQDDGH